MKVVFNRVNLLVEGSGFSDAVLPNLKKKKKEKRFDIPAHSL